MERRDQHHRLWVQEGLAALYEDFKIAEDGSIRFLPNERHNIARNRAKAGRLMRWSKLFEMDSEESGLFASPWFYAGAGGVVATVVAIVLVSGSSSGSEDAGFQPTVSW